MNICRKIFILFDFILFFRTKNILKVKKISSTAKLPTKNSYQDVGFDLYSDENVSIPPQSTAKIRCGIAIELPKGFWFQIEGRSGLGSKGIQPFAGIVDQGYQGEISVILFNSNKEIYFVKIGDKIAQGVIRELIQIHDVLEIKDFSVKTERGDKGFGSSGV
jgi:dUTP pyrophosphatase